LTPNDATGVEALASERERGELPEGWEWQKLGNPEVCVLNPRKSENASLPDNLEVTFVPMAAVGATQGAITEPQIRRFGEVRKGFTYFAEGDVLFAKITPCMENGKSAIARNLKNSVGFGTTEFHVLRPGPKVMAEWLYYLVRQKSFREEAASHMSGSAGQQRVPIAFMEVVEIPIAPLPEQHRIVARIEEIAQRAAEIRKLFDEMQAYGRELLLRAYARIVEDAPLMPFGEVAPLVRRPIKVEPSKEYDELGVRSFGRGTFHKPAISGSTVVKKLYRIEAGDLVFNNVFAWEGAVAVARPEDHGRVGSHRFLTCVPKKGLAKPSFLCFHFSTERGLQQLGEASPGSAGRNRTCNIKLLEKLQVPVPAFEKQVWFDALHGRLDAIKQSRAETQKELDALMPSVLAKAFAGEL